MNHLTPSQSQISSGFLFLSVSMITCLILLINVSFKIILLGGMVFAVSSLLCPLIAGIYLLVLRNCGLKEQRHILNIALITLYLFCIGVYVLVNLPAAEYMHDNPVYQIIFEDIPKKFFATTISFALSFYLPHLLFCSKSLYILHSPRQCVLFAVCGGLCFFCIDFYLLFSGPHAHSFKQIFIDSLMIASLLLLVFGVSYLSFLLGEPQGVSPTFSAKETGFTIYHYLVCFAVAVMLMCLACEYRIVALGRDSILSASCIFFPVTMVISTIIAEVWGYQAGIKFTLVLIAAQFIFDAFLMGIVAFPSPPFFNLNPFYNYIMPQRLPAASLSLLIAFLSNTLLLHYFQHSKWRMQRPLRILIANMCASSLLCLVDYSLLFGGIYPYEQIVTLATNVWQYKLVTTLIALPLVIWLCKLLEKNYLLAFACEQ
ncbi:MAG: VUT family protein [Legionella sp.]|nr:VUT family protein [Legionella sp.]